MLCTFILDPEALHENDVCSNHWISFFKLWFYAGVLLIPTEKKLKQKLKDSLIETSDQNTKPFLKKLFQSGVTQGHRRYFLEDKNVNIIYENLSKKNEVKGIPDSINALVLRKSVSNLSQLMKTHPGIYEEKDVCNIRSFPAAKSVYRSLLTRNNRIYEGYLARSVFEELFSNIGSYCDHITIIDRYCGVGLYKQTVGKKRYDTGIEKFLFFLKDLNKDVSVSIFCSYHQSTIVDNDPINIKVSEFEKTIKTELKKTGLGFKSLKVFWISDYAFRQSHHDRYIWAAGLRFSLGNGLDVFAKEKVSGNHQTSIGPLTDEDIRLVDKLKNDCRTINVL